MLPLIDCLYCLSSDTVRSLQWAHDIQHSDVLPFLPVRSDGGAECRASNPKFAAMEVEPAHSNGQGVSREQHSLP